MKSKLKIKLEHDYWVPGTPLKGEIVATTPHELEVRKIEVHLKGRFDTTLPQTHGGVSGLQWENWDKLYKDASENARTPHLPERELSGVNLAPSGIYRNSEDQYRSYRAFESQSRRYKIMTFTECLDLDQLLPSKRFPKEGTTALPFALNPTDHLKDYIQSGHMWSQHFTSTMQYYVQVDIKYPSSYYSLGLRSISLNWSQKTEIKNYLEKQTNLHDIEQYTNESEYQVGYWEKESLGLGQLVKYSLGGETGTDRFPMKLKLTLPSLVQISDTNPVYISDVAGLETSYDDGKMIQLVPAMELTRLKVRLHTLVTFRESGLGRITNQNQPEKSLFTLYTTELGAIPTTSVNIDPDTNNDLRSLLCGIKLPENVLSSCLTPNVQVYNFLHVSIRVRVRNEESDGTNQTVEKAEVSGLINIQRVVPDIIPGKKKIKSGSLAESFKCY